MGHQLAEVLRTQRGLARGPAHARSVELFTEVGLRDPDRVFHQYPHELSGGMLQRVLIAIAVSLEPELLIADEATTALDVVVQAEILQLLSRLRRTHELSLLLVTHDLAVVADTCDRVLVMYGGEIVESGPTEQVLRDPRHPYTRALLAVASIGDWSRRTLEVIPGQPAGGRRGAARLPVRAALPRRGGRLHRRAGLADHLAGREPVGTLPPRRGPRERRRPLMTTAPLLSVTDLTVTYAPPRRSGSLGTGAALAHVDLDVLPGEILGVVGETGSGKTTLARATVGLVRPAGGRIDFEGADLGALKGRELRTFLRSGQVQLAFQDPLRALDPDLTVGELVGEPLAVAGVPRGRAHPAGLGVPRPRRPGRRLVPRPLPPPALGRPAAARVARPRDRDPAAAAVLRRARQRAGRVQPQPRAPAARPAPPRPGPRGGDHRPRPQLARRRRRPGGRVLPRPAGRAGSHRRGAPAAVAPLHRPAHRVGPERAAGRDRLRPEQVRTPQADASWDATACVFASLCRFAHEACTQQPALRPVPGQPHRTAACHVADEWRLDLNHRQQEGTTRMTSNLEFIGITATQEVSDRRQVEFLGMIGTHDASESRPAPARSSTRTTPRRFARAHEDAGFDRVLIGYGSGWPEGSQVAAYVAAHTERLGLLVAHRPGFVAPTLAARTFATLDQFTNGRVAVHIITGGNDAEQRRDGDYLDHDERYARTDEYLTILRRAWTAPSRSTTRAGYYRFEDFAPACCRTATATCRVLRRLVGGGVPGRRQARRHVRAVGRAAGGDRRADRVGAGRRGPPAGRRRGSACRSGRSSAAPRSWPGSGRTGSSTRIKSGAGAAFSRSASLHRDGRPQNAGSQRLLAAAEKGDLHDRALWTPTAKAAGAGGNSTALVGTPETVAAALLDYVDIGVDTVLIRGYDPLDDAVDYGRDLHPAGPPGAGRVVAADWPLSGHPLQGVRVVELAHVAAGPFAGMLLADLGADVVKVEPPTGDQMRSWPPFAEDAETGEQFSHNFASVNRNKRSVVADLKDPADTGSRPREGARRRGRRGGGELPAGRARPARARLRRGRPRP